MPIFLSDTRPRPEAEEPREERRKRDPETTRKAILEAAEELFICHGPTATSLSRIAKQAGVTKSLIHHYFKSKDDLWREVQRRHFLEYFEVQKNMITDEASTAELLAESITTYFRFLQSHPKSVRFVSWSILEDEESQCAPAEEKELFELGISKIREAQEAGEIRSDLEPFFIIKTLISLPMAWFQSLAETRSLIDSDIRPEALDEMYLRDMVKIFLEGVRPRGESSSA